jgi:hypothetical protein
VQNLPEESGMLVAKGVHCPGLGRQDAPSLWSIMGETTMPNILDDLFAWAGAQTATNYTLAKIAMTTNASHENNVVSYAEGELIYHPGTSLGWFHVQPSFASKPDDVKQYFSDRRYGTMFAGSPFDSTNTDPLTISITWEITTYAVTFKSSKYGWTATFTPSFDTASNVIYGSVGGGFVTISLCGRVSNPFPM